MRSLASIAASSLVTLLSLSSEAAPTRAQAALQDVTQKQAFPVKEEAHPKCVGFPTAGCTPEPLPRAPLSPAATEFLGSVSFASTSLYRLAALEVDPSIDLEAYLAGEGAKKMMNDLSFVETKCQKLGESGQAALFFPENSSGVATRVGPFGKIIFPAEFVKVPGNWCHVASKRKDLMTKALANHVVTIEGYPDYMNAIANVTVHLTTAHPVVDEWLVGTMVGREAFVEKVRDSSKREYDQLGLQQKNNPAKTVDGMVRAMRQRVDLIASQMHFPTSGWHDDTVEKAMRIALRKELEGAAVQSSRLDDAEWTTSAQGTRVRTGQVLYKRPHFTWCEEREFVVTDGGKKSPSSEDATFAPEVRIKRCD